MNLEEKMQLQELKIPGAWVYNPIRFQDSRGHFEEQFKLSLIEKELGRSFPVVQVNQTMSNKGVIRGIHWTEGDGGTAKYVSCTRGSIWDVVVDLRASSPTYGSWDARILSEQNGASMLISEGLGHAFLALENHSLVNYLCTSEYKPVNERTINPLDLKISIDFDGMAKKLGIENFTLSDKDRLAGGFQGQ
jgi:dTDP-4-dehydrorhamnose 3,5-epimerase